MTELRLEYCQFPTFGDFADLVESFPRLESLDLVGVTWQDGFRAASESSSASGSESESRSPESRSASPCAVPRAGTSSGGTWRNLRRLTLGKDVDVESVTQWLLARSLHLDIETLSVCCTSQKHVMAVGSFVRALGPSSLRHFDLNWALQASASTFQIPFFFALVLLC